MFHCPDPGLTCLRLVEASLTTWRPDRAFDLITCVHGLHYVGDKLGLIARAASWLAEDGLFVANLDLANLKLADGRAAGRKVSIRPAASRPGVRPEEAAGRLPWPEGRGPAVPLPRGRRPGRAELHGAARRGLVLRARSGTKRPRPGEKLFATPT